MNRADERCYKFRRYVGNRAPLPDWSEVLPVHEHVARAVGHVRDRVEAVRNLAHAGATLTEPLPDEASPEASAAWSQFQCIEAALDQLVGDICELCSDTAKLQKQYEDLQRQQKAPAVDVQP